LGVLAAESLECDARPAFNGLRRRFDHGPKSNKGARDREVEHARRDARC